jgi:hypothetical protein
MLMGLRDFTMKKVAEKAEGKVDVEKLMAWLAKHPNPSDDLFHKFAEGQGWDVHKAEAETYKMASKFARFWLGGRSNEKGAPTSYDPKALAVGIKVELEHTPDRDVAEKITKDHLAEFETYYLGLKAMEKSLEVGEKKEG